MWQILKKVYKNGVWKANTREYFLGKCTFFININNTVFSKSFYGTSSKVWWLVWHNHFIFHRHTHLPLFEIIFSCIPIDRSSLKRLGGGVGGGVCISTLMSSCSVLPSCAVWASNTSFPSNLKTPQIDGPSVLQCCTAPAPRRRSQRERPKTQISLQEEASVSGRKEKP